MLDTFQDDFAAARALHESGRFGEAESAYRILLERRPDLAKLHNNLGVMCYSQGKHFDAIESYREALEIDADLVIAHSNLGAAYAALGSFELALASFKTAAALSPDDPQVLNNLSYTHLVLGQYAQAEPIARRAIGFRADFIAAWTNLGGALWGQAKYREAQEAYRQTIRHCPEGALAHKNLGIVCLQHQQYAEGWREYEWRWLADRTARKHTAIPEWDGRDLPSGALLVWGEQGVGDEVMQLGMLRDLLARGLDVVWACDGRLVPLVRRSYPNLRVMSHFAPVPGDVVASVAGASLGRFTRTAPEAFPTDLSYLKFCPTTAAKVRERLKVQAGERLVGVSWSSSGSQFTVGKSTALADWCALAAVPGVRFVDLQYGDTKFDRQIAAFNGGINLEHLDDLDTTSDLDGLAAVMGACDLVITISSVAAHLAAALGRPTWILVPARMGHFWYWGHEGESTPWYPMASLIRQEPGEPWSAVLGRVATDLSE